MSNNVLRVHSNCFHLATLLQPRQRSPATDTACEGENHIVGRFLNQVDDKADQSQKTAESLYWFVIVENTAKGHDPEHRVSPKQRK